MSEIETPEVIFLEIREDEDISVGYTRPQSDRLLKAGKMIFELELNPSSLTVGRAAFPLPDGRHTEQIDLWVARWKKDEGPRLVMLPDGYEKAINRNN